MDHYLTITLLPDPEFPAPLLMSALLNKLHKALVELQTNRIGVSFPNYGKTLGQSIRLHGEKAGLETLMSLPWLKGMLDHLQLADISSVPATAEYIRVTRKHCKSNTARLAARYAKRHDISEEEALVVYKDVAPQRLKLPFANITSQSTGQRFRLYIEQKKVDIQNPDATFNCYGLSSHASVPWF